MNDESTILSIVSLKKDYSISQKEILTVLKGISFSANVGEVIVLMGPSGAGKSTLMNIIAGLEKPTEGQVEINNRNIFDLSDDARTELRRDVLGIIFQFFELHQGLSCQETLELKLIIDRADCTREKVHQLLSEVGLEERIDRIVDSLSRGEKQRVAIARALVNDPKIILADEPTGALDFETAIEIMALLRQIARKLNSLLIISTHDYNIPQDGDRILLLEDGKIIKDISSISRSKYLQDSGVEDLILETL